MKLIITGNRTFTDYALLKSNVEELILKNFKDPIELIITRGREGAEKLGEQFATEFDIPVQQFLPDTETFGDEATVIADTQMVGVGTYMIIFWDGVATRKSHTLEQAHKKGIPVEVVKY